MICCGKDRKTPFCPECGKRLLADHPLLPIIQHVVGLAERHEKHATTLEGYTMPTDKITRKIFTEKRAAEKYRAWECVLRELLAEQAEGERP